MVKKRIALVIVFSLIAVGICLGCAGPSEEEPDETVPTPTEPVETEPIPTEPVETELAEEEPNATQLYNYMTEENNYTTWDLWPNTSELFEGTEPHGAFVTVYISDEASDAIEDGAGVMPDGSMIVKENYNPEEELVAITVMYKVEDYDPEHNDWFWAKYSSNGTVEAEGKVLSCIGCHEARKDNDYIFTGNITT